MQLNVKCIFLKRLNRLHIHKKHVISLHVKLNKIIQHIRLKMHRTRILSNKIVKVNNKMNVAQLNDGRTLHNFPSTHNSWEKHVPTRLVSVFPYKAILFGRSYLKLWSCSDVNGV